jgi:flagellar basal body-associated protein FliL
MNENDDIAKVKDYDDETSSNISSYNFNKNNKINDNKFERKSFLSQKVKPVRKNRKMGEDKKSKSIKITYTILIITSFLYLITVLCCFLIISKEFIYCGIYIYHMQNYHNNILELFNSFREYLFDENHIILGLPTYEYLLKKEKIIYISNTEDINYLTLLSKYIKGLFQKFTILQEKGYCSSYISYFNSQDECKDYIGGENGIISLGFHLLINSFMEELRNARNLMTLFLDEKIIVGNLSEIIDKTDDDETFGIDVNKTLMFRMQVFNLEQIHKRVNIIFLNIILQYINQERDITIDSTNESLTNVYIPYIIILIVYIVILLLAFFIYWIPMIQERNIEIYKTKNMLSIIPVKILATQPNIRELLNISNKD